MEGLLLAMILWILFLPHDQSTKDFPQKLHVAVIAYNISNNAGMEDNLVSLLLEEDQSTKDFPQKLRVAVMACKVRNGAGVGYDLIGYLSEDDEVTALDLIKDKDGGTWYKIDRQSLPADLKISGEECYIRSDLLITNE